MGFNRKDVKYINMEYLGGLILCSVILYTIISGASYRVELKQPDIEKVSVYECGFHPFDQSRVIYTTIHIVDNHVDNKWMIIT